MELCEAMLVAAAAPNTGNPMRLLYVALAALLIASDAQADVLTGTYSGFVDPTPASGLAFYDQGNYFGFGANASLGGLPISVTFTYNPDSATAQVCAAEGAGVCTNYFGVMNTMTATIGDHTVTATGTQFSELALANHDFDNQGISFDLIAVNSLVNIAVLVRTFSDQFTINPADPNSPNFSVTNPDQFIAHVLF